MGNVLLIPLFCASCCVAWAQDAPGDLAFEAASLKPHDSLADVFGSVRGGPGTNSPGQITALNVSLRDLVAYSYSAFIKRMILPDWLTDVRYDVVAKLPAWATEPQAHLMMRGLLKERLELQAHWEARETPVYALVVGKSGEKITARHGSRGPSVEENTDRKSVM